MAAHRPAVVGLSGQPGADALSTSPAAVALPQPVGRAGVHPLVQLRGRLVRLARGNRPTGPPRRVGGGLPVRRQPVGHPLQPRHLGAVAGAFLYGRHRLGAVARLRDRAGRRPPLLRRRRGRSPAGADLRAGLGRAAADRAVVGRLLAARATAGLLGHGRSLRRRCFALRFRPGHTGRRQLSQGGRVSS